MFFFIAMKGLMFFFIAVKGFDVFFIAVFFIVPTSVECRCCFKPTSSMVVLTLLVVVTTSALHQEVRTTLDSDVSPT